MDQEVTQQIEYSPRRGAFPVMAVAQPAVATPPEASPPPQAKSDVVEKPSLTLYQSVFNAQEKRGLKRSEKLEAGKQNMNSFASELSLKTKEQGVQLSALKNPPAWMAQLFTFTKLFSAPLSPIKGNTERCVIAFVYLEETDVCKALYLSRKDLFNEMEYWKVAMKTDTLMGWLREV